MGDRQCQTAAMTAMTGKDNTAWNGLIHPEWLAQHLRQAFQLGSMKPTTAEVLQILRAHCSKIFRCMYNTSGRNRVLESEFVAEMIAVRFGFDSAVHTRRRDCYGAYGPQ